MKSRRMFEQSQAWLLNHLDAVRPAISTEYTRYYLNGICLQTDDQKHLLLTTTDGHRLHHNKTDTCLQKALPSAGVIMARDMIKHLSRLLNKKSNQPVTLRLNGQTSENFELFAIVGDITLCGRAIDGQFPDWQRVVPSGDNNQTVTFDRAELIQSLKSLPSREHTKTVTLYIDPADLGTYLAIKTSDGLTARTRVKSQSSAMQAMTVTYNGNYLLDALGSIPGDTATLTLFTDQRRMPGIPPEVSTSTVWVTCENPAILRQPGAQDFRVLMPIRAEHARIHFARTGSLEPETDKSEADLPQAA